jgi:protein-arginine kinase activator protein McsA
MQLCSKCKKRLAVVFISKMTGEKIENEGFCIRCARELGIAQVDAIMKQYGISDEDLDKMEPVFDNPDDLPAIV